MEVVITRRFFSFILAGVIAASTIFPASAWDKDSFISGGEEYESSSDVVSSDDLSVPDVYAAPRRAPQMYRVSADDQAAADANTTGRLVVPATLPTSVDGTFEVMTKYYHNSSAGGVKVESDYWRDVVHTCVPNPKFLYDYIYYFADYDLSYNPSISDSNDMVRGLAAFCDKSSGVFPPGYTIAGSGGGNLGIDSWSFTVNYDVSSYSSSAFSLDGIWSVIINYIAPDSSVWQPVLPLSVDVLVDGQQVLSLSRGSSVNIDFGGYVYSGSSNISTISFRWHMPFWVFLSDTQGASTYSLELISFVSSTAANALIISFLSGQDVINAQNDKTKSDINKHEEYESQWTGSMTENFNKLDVGNFTFHSGLIAGFAMVSGIFMDLWRGMGDAAVAYVFPLTLAVVLMLLGRISRTGGKRGTEEGDDSS